MPYDFWDDVHTAITYEFDLTFYQMKRKTYNVLDWLKDFGGLRNALKLILGLLYTFIHYKSFKNFMVQKLYRPGSSKY